MFRYCKIYALDPADNVLRHVYELHISYEGWISCNSLWAILLAIQSLHGCKKPYHILSYNNLSIYYMGCFLSFETVRGFLVISVGCSNDLRFDFYTKMILTFSFKNNEPFASSNSLIPFMFHVVTISVHFPVFTECLLYPDVCVLIQFRCSCCKLSIRVSFGFMYLVCN